MPFVPVSNTALLELIFEQHGSVVENTLWFENNTAIGSSDLQNLATDMKTWWEDFMAPIVSIDTTLVRVRATDMTSSTSEMFEYSPTTGNVGLVNSSSMPNQLTWVVKFLTALRGRSFRGRNYIVGIPISQLSEDSVIPTFANNVIDAYNEISGLLLLTNWKHVVVSKFSGGNPRLSGVTTDVTGYAYTDLYTDNQRRRAAGRGD